MPKRHVDWIPISEFKAKSLALLERVRRTGRPIVVTKRGEPIAEVIPPTSATVGHEWIGSMVGTARLRGNLVLPAAKTSDWDALRK